MVQQIEPRPPCPAVLGALPPMQAGQQVIELRHFLATPSPLLFSCLPKWQSSDVMWLRFACV